MSDIETISKPCLDRDCGKEMSVVLDKTVEGCAGVLRCKACGERHVFYGGNGILMNWQRESKSFKEGTYDQKTGAKK